MLDERKRSFLYAFQGLRTVWRTQTNMRIHLSVALLVVALGWWLELSKTDWCLLVLAISMVLMAEAFNTALEFLTDLASPDYHPLAKHAKDTAAAAVLLAAIGSAVLGLLILGPPLLQRLGLIEL
jgi:diacylglycerol kinase